MTGVVRHAVHTAVPLSAMAVIAGLGFPAVAMAGGVAVAVIAAVCWVVSSRERSDRMTRIILGIRGDARSLDFTPSAGANVPPALPAPSAGPGESRVA